MIGNWKAVLFDLDGTLIDSEWFYYKAWRKALEQYGFELSSDTWLNDLAGKTDIQTLDHLRAHYGFVVDHESFFPLVRAIVAEQYDTETVSLMPGVSDLINFLKALGITMAVVTSSKREAATYHLERNGLREYMSVLVSRTDVDNPKPNPEPYRRCVEQLGLKPEECLALEDSFTGATSAKNAGVACFGVQTNRSIRESLPTDRAFDNLHEVREYLEGLVNA